nr:piggyBac transposable element-derived protein 4-like [Rhipicephalus microplus]
MAAFRGAAFYGVNRNRKRPRVSDETAERILERIAGTATPNIDLSDSDDDTLVDTTFLAPLDTLSSEEDENSDDERPSTSKTTKGQSWKRHDGPLPSWIPDFTSTPDDSQQRVSCSPSDYLVQYVPHEVFEMMAFAMNTTHVQETGKSLETSIRMYWMKKTRVPLVADNMTKNRYFQLRRRLKLVNKFDVSEQEKEKDRLWRMRPLVSFLLEGCQKLPREENVSIDEQMIPFSRRTQLKQFVPRKPNPQGLKNFVLATPGGLIFDSEIYQGKKAALYPGSSGIEESAVLRLTETLPPGTKVYFDRYFTSGPLLDKLAENGIAGTGTIMNNRIPKGVKLSTQKELKEKGREKSEMFARSDKKQAVVRCGCHAADTLHPVLEPVLKPVPTQPQPKGQFTLAESMP